MADTNTINASNDLTFLDARYLSSKKVESITVTSPVAFSVGQTTSHAAFNVDTSVVSGITGLNIQAQTSGNGIKINVTGSSNEPFIFLPNGTGSFQIWLQSASGKFSVMNSTGGSSSVDIYNSGSDGTPSGKIDILYNGSAIGGLSLDSTHIYLDAFSTNQFQIRTNGSGAYFFGTSNVTVADAYDMVFGTGTGSKIGSAANQKMGWWGHAPAVQPTKAGHNNWTAISDVTSALASVGLVDAA